VDVALTILLGLIQATMAGLGIYVSVKPQPPERHKKLVWAFIVLALLGIGLNAYQQYRNGQSQQRLQSRLDRIDQTGGQIANGMTEIRRFLPTSAEVAPPPAARPKTKKAELPEESPVPRVPANESMGEISRGLADLRSLLIGQRWGLTAEQLITLSKRLSLYAMPKARGDLITCVLGDPDSTKFALSLVSAFRSAGWNLPGSGYNQAVFSGNPIGVIVKLNSRESKPAGLSEFVATLKESGIEPTGEVDSGVPSDEFQIILGRRPER